MRHHRFLIQSEPIPIPQPPAPTPGMNAFILCPVIMPAGMSPPQLLAQQMLYQQAFAEALAVVRPSLPERDLLAVWN